MVAAQARGDDRRFASVLVVDDDSQLREFLNQLLSERRYVVFQAATGEEAIDIARRERPALVLLDVRLPGISGYEVCWQLRAEFGNQLPVIFISGERVEPFDRAVALRIGGDDYLVKPFAPDELLARMERLLEREVIHDDGRGRSAVTDLTPRELEILQLLADGLTVKEISNTLAVSHKTVSSHLHNILLKLDVHSQAQAVGAAFRRGLV